MSKPKNPLLASKTGLISSLKTFRETPKAYYVTYYGEGDREVRISKSETGRKMFTNVDDAQAWIEGRSRRPEEITECRRPGLTAIRDELADANPRWSLEQASAEAKQEWHRRNPGPRTAS